MLDIDALPPAVQRLIKAAQQIDRDNLDEVSVHVCDRGDDEVCRKGLHFAQLDLSMALAELGLTMPQGR